MPRLDLSTIIDNFISTNNFDWKKYISICTDGTKDVFHPGSCCELRSLIQQRARTCHGKVAV